jgi:hypothetical protein
MGFTVSGGKIAEIHMIADRSALADSTWLSSMTPTASRPVGAEGQVA